MVENESILRQKIMQQMNSRSKRSPQVFSGTALLQDQAKEDEIPDEVKLLAIPCVALFAKMAEAGVEMEKVKGDRNYLIIIRAIGICGKFMTEFSTELMKDFQEENNGKTDDHLLQDQGILKN